MKSPKIMQSAFTVVRQAQNPRQEQLNLIFVVNARPALPRVSALPAPPPGPALGHACSPGPRAMTRGPRAAKKVREGQKGPQGKGW
jgi:hypothetical protein